MFKCECGREFTTPQGLGYHKKFCGNYKIFIDGGYEAKIGPDGNIVYIHREAMEKKLGRKLKPGEVVHHKDENKRNNDPNNLELKTESTHGKYHYNKQSDQWKFNFKNSNPTGIGLKHFKGSKHPNSKLTEDRIVILKTKLNENNTRTSLAKEFGIDRKTVRDIRDGKSWKHITI